jgi:hypothetical protein
MTSYENERGRQRSGGQKDNQQGSVGTVAPKVDEPKSPAVKELIGLG